MSGRKPSAGERAAISLDGRLPVMEGGRELLRKVFPDHWSFLLGELALYSFVVLLLTGVYLTFFFDPSMREIVYDGSYLPLRGVSLSEAYASTLRISFDVRGGLLIRQVHHWSALLFVSAIGVHLLRVFFTGAFRRPRELNWVIGVTLFNLALLEGFSGYSLPDDTLSGTGLRIAEGVLLSVPLVGSYLTFFAFGGEFPGHTIVPRLFSLHILLVPGLLLALIGAHLTLVVVLKHTQWAAPGRTNRNVVGMPFFPQFMTRTLGLLFTLSGIMALSAFLAEINPIWRYGSYRPDVAGAGAQPDWYIGFIEGALRLMPAAETRVLGHTVSWSAFVPSLVVPGLLFAVLYAYPFAERWLDPDPGEHHLCDRPRNKPTRTALGAAGIAFYAVLLIAGGNDVIAYTFGVSVNTLTEVLRAALIVLPPVSFMLARRICLALQARDRTRLLEGDRTGRIDQSPDGGFTGRHRPVRQYERVVMLVREVPVPQQAPDGAPRRERVRAAVSSWFYGDRVELPATERELERVAGVLTAPAHPRTPAERPPRPTTTGPVRRLVRRIMRRRRRGTGR
ncbi:cytochrome bc complex cytochrome b subunit [Streptomyces kaniharaensis]|uniref:Cytochrome bc1 complex cytochrome b subunit n=1 Tax=Streptomyces kaniharaensis TaxID=212423 RepID=A0A6N7L251_9ACTN|nr:cytochrome bc complex cytochrome b subunit [Streptomyces kaniharaensis]MQS16797.1 cytochrome bc complex cytochrome b subunit [Streptomyces kaniharaensis]